MTLRNAFADMATEATLAALNAKLPAVANNRVQVELPSGASGLTDNELRAVPVPVSGVFYQTTQPVSGNFYQATQPVSGTFWQATQPVSLVSQPLPTGASTETTLAALKTSVDSLSAKVTSVNTGAVVVSSAPTTQVTGSFYPATQPVSAVTLPLPTGAATEATIAAVNAKLPALSSGRIPVELPAGGTGLTDAELRLNPVPVSGPFYQATQPVSVASLPLPTGAATEATIALTTKQKNTAATITDYGQVMFAQRRDADTTETTGDGQYTALKQDEAGRLKVATQPASNPSVSGNITANAQNVSIPCGRFGNLSVSMVATSLVGHNVSFECSNNSTNGTDGNWYGVQAVRSNANTVETTTGVLAATPIYMWHINVGDYLYFRVRATAHTSGTATYVLKPGSYATEPIPAVQITGTQPVSGTVTATVTAGTVNPVVPATPYFLNSAATTNGALILTGTSNVSSFYATNEGATVAYVKLYNKATAPTVGTDVPEMIIPVPAAVSGVPGVANPNIGFHGFRFALGLGIAVTGAAVYTDTTAIAAGQVKVKLSRTV